MSQAFKDLHWRRDIPLKEYLVPETLSQALQMLDEYKGRARIIAGGTDVIVELRSRHYEVEALVDISRIPGMGGIELQGDSIILGGLVTHAQTAASPLIQEKAGLLACRLRRDGFPSDPQHSHCGRQSCQRPARGRCEHTPTGFGRSSDRCFCRRRASDTVDGILLGCGKDRRRPKP